MWYLWRSLCRLFFSLSRCSLSLVGLWRLESRNAMWTLGLGSPSCVSRERRRFWLSDRSSWLLDPSVSGWKYNLKKHVSQIFWWQTEEFSSFPLLLTPSWTFGALQNKNCSISSHSRRKQRLWRLNPLKNLNCCDHGPNYLNVSVWCFTLITRSSLCILTIAQLLSISERNEGRWKSWST